jgi:beta-aspartyl-peptidase (threonine type)
MLASVMVLALSASPRGTADEAEAVRELLRRQVVDWNKSDLDGFLEGYWNSPKLVFQSGGTRSEGWQAVRERYRQRYQAEGRAMGKLEFKNVEVELLGPDAAFARGRWELTMPDGQRPGGLFTLVLRKLPEVWRIVHDHTSADAPM